MFQRNKLQREKEVLELHVRQLNDSITQLEIFDDWDTIESYPILDLISLNVEEVNTLTIDYDSFQNTSRTNKSRSRKSALRALINAINLCFYNSHNPAKAKTSSELNGFGVTSIRQIKNKLLSVRKRFIRITKNLTKSLRGTTRLIDFQNLTRTFRLNILPIHDDEDLNITSTLFAKMLYVKSLNHQ